MVAHQIFTQTNQVSVIIYPHHTLEKFGMDDTRTRKWQQG